MAKKRNARREDGRIAVQVYLGRDENNKRICKNVYGRTQKEAEEKALAVKLALKKGLDVLAERDTFGEWAKRWLRIKESEVSNGQYRACACALKHLEPVSLVEIGRIRPADIQDILSTLAKKNPNTGKPAAAKTLKSIKDAASQVFRLAIESRVIDYDPVSAVRIPKSTEPQKRRALTPEEQRWIINTPHRAQTAAMIMMFAGLRRGELIPLTWSDIDLDAHTITIDKAVEVIQSRFVVKPTAKTETSLRVVDIPAKLAEYLRLQPRDHLLVCTNAQGKMHTQSSFERMWESYLCELNCKYGDTMQRSRNKFSPEKMPFVIPRITPHWLRHTCATNMYLAGIDALAAKEQLGHANIQTTLEIYTHLDRQYKRRSIAKLDEYLAHAE